MCPLNMPSVSGTAVDGTVGLNLPSSLQLVVYPFTFSRKLQTHFIWSHWKVRGMQTTFTVAVWFSDSNILALVPGYIAANPPFSHCAVK